MAKDLKQFLTVVEKEHPDYFRRVTPEINTQQFEVTAFLKIMEDKGKEQIVLFENPLSVSGEKSFPLVSNVFATRGLCALALDLPYEQHRMELVEEFGKREQNPGQIEITADAPSQEVIWTGDKADLWKLPTPMSHQDDVGPYFTMTCIMKGIESEFYDITFTKNWTKGPHKMSVSAHGHHHQARLCAEYTKQNKRAPVVVVLGHHPAFYLSSCCLMPFGNNDYLTASSFLKEPIRLAPSVTWGEDFMVPADAEIIVEAEILPGVLEEQNPFGEIAGYYQFKSMLPVAEVTAITMKKNPIMQAVFPGHPEHWTLGGIPKEGSVYSLLKRNFPGVKAVYMPPSGNGRYSCTISMNKQFQNDPIRAAMSTFPEIENLKMAVIVDDDVDVYDEREVHWAVITRTHWDKDVEIIRKVQDFRKWLGDAVVVIDATRPPDPNFPKKNEIPLEAIERIKQRNLI